ncbi:chromodomain-helicase-DNA-binding protein 1-like protein [Aphelenchoides avenae]|nr:chromodomain-helicase-DNA-binding protein 1-like protein [Aphelenchus avenae]
MASKFDLEQAQKALTAVGLPLHDHQLEGVETILSWYAKGHGGILADEMGLGKTSQAVVALTILASQGRVPGLIICPLSVLDHWENELIRFSCGRLKVFRYYGSKAEREVVRRTTLRTQKWDVMLTSFETFLQDHGLLQFTWECVVFDEAHRVKNDVTLMHTALTKARINWILLMTGTPVQNRLAELYALLQLIDKKKFPARSQEEFLQKFRNTKDQKVADEFHALFYKYCLRRTKDLVCKDLPKCFEVKLYHGLTELQQNLYKAILTENRQFFLDNTSSVAAARQSLMGICTQLFKVCNHPYLFKGIEPKPYVDGEHLVESSGKMLSLDRLLKYLYKKGHKVLLFSQMKGALTIIEDIFCLRGYKYERLDGNVKSADRLKAVENFQRPNSDVFCFLLTPRAGGIGLTLTAADTVIFLDWDWNPQNDKQAAARCHRIGQTKPVRIIRLLASNTIEEVIKYRASRKLQLSEFVLGEKEQVSVTSATFKHMLLEGMKDLMEAKGASAESSNAVTDQELEALIGATDSNGLWKVEEGKENTPLAEPMEEDDENDELMDAKAIYKFEGKDYSEKDRKVLDELLQSPSQKTAALDPRIAAVATQARVSTKPRKVLSDEEKEERRKRRKENEKNRREQREKAKAERKARLWQQNGYESQNLPLPEEKPKGPPTGFARIYRVFGDVTQPQRAKEDAATKALVLHALDDGGHFGVGGVFSALRQLSHRIGEAYELAGRMKDLHRGDSHLVEDVSEQADCAGIQLPSYGSEVPADSELTGKSDPIKRTVSAVLMVYQGVQDRYQRMVHKPSLEDCLNRVAEYAAKNDASVHMTQIWYGTHNLDEQQTLSLLQKYLCSRGINVYIYFYRRPGGGPRNTSRRPGPPPKVPAWMAAKRPRKAVDYSDELEDTGEANADVEDDEKAVSEKEEEEEAMKEEEETEEEFVPDEEQSQSSESEFDSEEDDESEEDISTSEEEPESDDEPATQWRGGKRHRRT